MDDVVIAGAGPAGSFAALILARAGLRVRMFERARFPRHKLCGDTLNPGALDVLRRHVNIEWLLDRGDPIEGMMVSGPGGVRVRGVYGCGLTGRAMTRAVFDEWLASRAVEAGAQLEEGAVVKEAVCDAGTVAGVKVMSGTSAVSHRARLVIAADGRRSSIGIGRGLSRQPPAPRRWAIGRYFTGVPCDRREGEMHVRRGHYIGVAPLPGGITNACLVVSHVRGEARLGAPADMLQQHLDIDPELRDRFSNARAASDVSVLGPMAVEARAAGEPGLLLAGDAAGFIDPMTGDGLRFALAGAELAAAIAIDVLGGRLPMNGAHLELAARRRTAFARKWRFNRALRSLVSSPNGVSGAAVAARLAPALFESIIRYAGDCRFPVPGSRLPV